MHFIASRGIGRGEVYIDLVNELCTKLDIVLLIPKDSLYKYRINDRIQVIEYSAKNSRNNPLLLLELWRKIKIEKPEMVHTHFGKASQIFKKINILLNIPHVATKHNPRKGKVFNVLPHVIAVSKGVKESIKNENVKIIYNGVHPIKVEEHNTSDVFTLLAVGRLDKIKGFDLLIKECAKLSFSFRLLIVGEGKERSHLENLITELKLENKVELLGFRKDIPQLMKDTDVVVMSSHSEGFSLVMVEALFYANIFVSTKVSGATEVLSDKFLIDKFNIANMINDIYHEQESFKHDFQNLQDKVAKKFLLQNIANNHILYYQNIYTSRDD